VVYLCGALGYLLLVVLFSNGASVSIGGFMLTWLMKVGSG
jgi:hypothetical protein